MTAAQTRKQSVQVRGGQRLKDESRKKYDTNKCSVIERGVYSSCREQISNKYIEKLTTNNSEKTKKISSSRNHKKNIQSQYTVCLHGCGYVILSRDFF